MKRSHAYRILAVIPFAALALLGSGGQGRGGEQRAEAAPPTQAPPAFEAFSMGDAIEEMDVAAKGWWALLERPSMTLGVYRVAADATDDQEPHELDEAYYVVQGKANFTAGGRTLGVERGAVLFVAAGTPHRFHDVEEDLVALVFFSKRVADEKD